MKADIMYEIQMKPEVATYFFDRFKEYVVQNPEVLGKSLTYSDYLGNVVLASLKSLFEGKVPEIYDPNKEEE